MQGEEEKIVSLKFLITLHSHEAKLLKKFSETGAVRYTSFN